MPEKTEGNIGIVRKIAGRHQSLLQPRNIAWRIVNIYEILEILDPTAFLLFVSEMPTKIFPNYCICHHGTKKFLWIFKTQDANLKAMPGGRFDFVQKTSQYFPLLRKGGPTFFDMFENFRLTSLKSASQVKRAVNSFAGFCATLCWSKWFHRILVTRAYCMHERRRPPGASSRSFAAFTWAHVGTFDPRVLTEPFLSNTWSTVSRSRCRMPRSVISGPAGSAKSSKRLGLTAYAVPTGVEAIGLHQENN